MDIFDAYISVPIIVICFVVGYIIKNSTIFGNVANQNIPLICTIVGAIFGLIMVGLSAEGIIIGAVSGLASTGVHQMRTQFCELKASKECFEEGPEEKSERIPEEKTEGDVDE